MTLSLPELDNTPKLQVIIDYNIGSWPTIKGGCTKNCKVKIMQKIEVSMKNTILILQLLLFTKKDSQTFKITNYKINEVPKTIIVINKQRYTIISGIFHHGNSIEFGHYTNMLRKDKHWIKISDASFCKKPSPKSAKDAYIYFFLERV